MYRVTQEGGVRFDSEWAGFNSMKVEASATTYTRV